MNESKGNIIMMDTEEAIKVYRDNLELERSILLSSLNNTNRNTVRDWINTKLDIVNEHLESFNKLFPKRDDL